MKKLLSIFAASLLTVGQAYALPVLQIGPDPADAGAVYDAGDQTWVFSGTDSAYAPLAEVVAWSSTEPPASSAWTSAPRTAMATVAA